MHPAQYLRRSAQAKYLKDTYGIGSTRTLAKLAVTGSGPRLVYVGRIPLSTREWLDEWMQSKLSTPVVSTSEAKAVRKDLVLSLGAEG
jgi:hypothetical protein